MKLFWVLALGIVAGLAPATQAATRRYALLVGLNEVPNADLAPLKHAEREMQTLANLLVERGRFKADRIELLVGDRVTLEAVNAAFDRLAAQIRDDGVAADDDETLVFIVWNGHGNAGELLTRTAPLTGRSLWQQVGALGGTLQVGFFDACYSGGLTAKGVRHVTPFNPFDQLPPAPLGSRGSFNVSSSRGDQRSFEHPEHGSLMMTALTRAFSEAAPGRSAMALEQDMLPFIRREMSRLAVAYGVEQTPQWKSNLVSTRPIFMSWPLARSAEVVLPDPSIDCVDVEYIDSGYAERLHRSKAHPRVRIFARPARLGLCDGSSTQRVTHVEPGDVIPFTGRNSAQCQPWPGRCIALTDKSGGTQWLLSDAVTAHLGGGVSYGWSGAPAVAVRVNLGGRLAWGRWATGLDLSWGQGDGEANGLAYSVAEGGVRVLAERSIWSSGLLDLTVGAGPLLSMGRHTWKASRAGDAHASWVRPGVVGLGRLWMPMPFDAQRSYLAIGGGVQWQAQTTYDALATESTGWRPSPIIELTIASRRWAL